MPSLVPAHRGYRYQDIAAAVLLARGIVVDASVTARLDRKLHSADRFDDVTLTLAGIIVRRQIKSSVAADTEWTLADFTTDGRSLRLDLLAKGAMQDLAFLTTRYAASAPFAISTGLRPFLVPSPQLSPAIAASTLTWRLNIEALWPADGEPVWDVLRGIERAEFVAFAERFLIESQLPAASLDLHTPGPLEHTLFTILVDEIGVGTYPNRERRVEDVAAALIDIAYQTRTGTGEISGTEVLRRLGLRTDYGRVAQRFPIIKTALVERTALIGRFTHAVRTQPATALIGPPGAGKSWLLTESADVLAQNGALVARHYCYLEPGDEEVQRRVTTDALFANMIAEITDQAPHLAEAVRPRFGSGPRELEMLLAAATEADPDRQVILIIDGLDHISRVVETASSIARDDTAIVDELALLSLPPNVRLVVASQPGMHLDPIRERVTVFSMPPWTEGEIGLLAERLSVPTAMRDAGLDDDDDLRDTLLALAARADGNPLYATFLCRTIVARLQQDGTPPLEVLNAAPAIDGDISKYYAFLLPSEEHVARALADVLAFVEFGLTPDELQTIYPAHAPYVTAALKRLQPVLRQVTAQGGIRLYHESLRRYVISQAADGPQAAAARILPPIITWLENAGLFANSRAYRFLLPLFARAGRTSDISARVQADFVERSVASGHAPAAIHANLALALNTSAESGDWSSVIRAVELERARRTFADRMEHSSLLQRYGTAYIALFGADALAERLMFDGKRTLDRERGLVLCALCDDAGAAPPWREYLRRGADDEETRDGDDVASEAAFHGYVRGDPTGAVKALVAWLEHDLQPGRFRHAFAVIARAVQLTDANTVLAAGAELTERRRALLALGVAQALVDSDAARATDILVDIPAGDCPQSLLDLFADLTGRDAEALDAAFDVIEVARVVPDGRRFGAAETAAWLASIRLAARVAPDKLVPVGEALAGGGWGHAWLRFALAIAQAEVVTDPELRDDATLRALAELRDAESHPDPFALSDVAPAIHRTLQKALQLVPSLTAFGSAVEILAELSRATQSHFRGGSMGALVTEDFIDVLTPYISDPERAEIILPAMLARIDATEAYGEFYETHAEHDLQMANIYARIGRRADAEARWNRAATHLTAYGWRRDITAYEPIESLEVIAGVAPDAARARLAEAQVLAENVIEHTDGKDTRHILNRWFDSLLAADPARALDLLARSIWASEGGVDWRIEHAFEEVANSMETANVDPLLAAHIQAAARADGETKSVSARGPVLERLSAVGSDAAPYVTILAGAVTGDAPAIEAGAVDALTTFGQQHRVALPPISARRNPKYSPPTSTPTRPRTPQISNPLPLTARELVLAVHKGPSSFRDDPDAVESYAQQLGYRLLGLDDDITAIRVLRVFARASFYSGGDAVLSILGEGFARHGQPELAATAHALAYAYARGDWSVFGSRAARSRFAAAVAIDEGIAHGVLRAEAMWFFAKYGGNAGLTQHPIELFVALGDIDRALAIWDASVDVIRRRLPLPAEGYRPFVRYDPAQPAPALDAAAASLLVARALHPEHQRKISALAGIAAAVEKHTETLVSPLATALSSAPLTMQLSILNILASPDDEGLWCVRALAPALRELTASAFLGVRDGAQELLDRIGDTADRLSPPAVARAQPLPPDEVEALASIDHRVDTLEQLVPGFAVTFASFAEEASHDEDRKARSRERSQLFYDRVLERFPKHILYDHQEIKEELLHRTGGVCLPDRTNAGADDVAAFLSPRIERYVVHWFSRTARPANLERPTARVAGRTAPAPIDDPAYPGWYRIGYYEREFLRSTEIFRNITGEQIVMSGMQLHPGGSADREACLLNGHVRQRGTSLFLAAMHVHHGPLGPVHLLLPAVEVMERFSLQPGAWTAPFVARDRHGTAMVYRQWRHEPLGDDLEKEEPLLCGCELLLRPDLYRSLYEMAAGWVSEITVVTS
ncbi:MAG TPA: ATP-binding protein [Thermoanaerobaculia bacterium]|nr:ATP-binding protein [Thermoanaerobaculia bacterium]